MHARSHRRRAHRHIAAGPVDFIFGQRRRNIAIDHRLEIARRVEIHFAHPLETIAGHRDIAAIGIGFDIGPIGFGRIECERARPDFRLAPCRQIVFDDLGGLVIREGRDEALIGLDRVDRDHLFISLVARQAFDVAHILVTDIILIHRDGAVGRLVERESFDRQIFDGERLQRALGFIENPLLDNLEHIGKILGRRLHGLQKTLDIGAGRLGTIDQRHTRTLVVGDQKPFRRVDFDKAGRIGPLFGQFLRWRIAVDDDHPRFGRQGFHHADQLAHAKAVEAGAGRRIDLGANRQKHVLAVDLGKTSAEIDQNRGVLAEQLRLLGQHGQFFEDGLLFDIAAQFDRETGTHQTFADQIGIIDIFEQRTRIIRLSDHQSHTVFGSVCPRLIGGLQRRHQSGRHQQSRQQQRGRARAAHGFGT